VRDNLSKEKLSGDILNSSALVCKKERMGRGREKKNTKRGESE
jgi:hypothetical protein